MTLRTLTVLIDIQFGLKLFFNNCPYAVTIDNDFLKLGQQDCKNYCLCKEKLNAEARKNKSKRKEVKLLRKFGNLKFSLKKWKIH